MSVRVRLATSGYEGERLIKRRENRTGNKKVVSAAWSALIAGFTKLSGREEWRRPIEGNPEEMTQRVLLALRTIPLPFLETFQFPGAQEVLAAIREEDSDAQRLDDVIPWAARMRSEQELGRIRSRILAQFRQRRVSVEIAEALMHGLTR